MMKPIVEQNRGEGKYDMNTMEIDLEDNKIITELSNKFSELLCKRLGKKGINKVIKADKDNGHGGSFSGCFSHDYCDADQIMVNAVNYMFGVGGWFMSDHKITNLMGESWAMSIDNEFKL